MSYVYFIQSGDDGLIKIGFSTNVSGRLNDLKVGSGVELKLLRKVKAPRHVETVAHRRFAHIRSHREWFQPAQELLDYIGSLDLWGDLHVESDAKKVHPRMEPVLALLKARHPVGTAHAVSEVTGVPSRTVEGWLRGRSAPTMGAALSLIQVYGPEMAYAFTGDDIYLAPPKPVADYEKLVRDLEEMPDEVEEKADLLARAVALRDEKLAGMHQTAESYRRLA